MLIRDVSDRWHADFVVAHDEPMRPAELPGFVAVERDAIVGHAAIRIEGDACELVAIAASPSRQGTGSALLERVVTAAREAGRSRVWLTTTNDNLDALRFYQRRGFRLAALRPGAVVEARRRWKPDLPPTGSFDIPCATSSTPSFVLSRKRSSGCDRMGASVSFDRPMRPAPR